MTPDLLAKHFDRISEAPDAIPRLRRFILDLAVRGKLLSQNGEDEPASELFKRIRAEKERSVNLGTIKSAEAHLLGPIPNLPWPLPLGWEFSSLQSLCLSVTDGDHQPPPKAERGIPFLVIGNVRAGVLNLANCRFVSPEYYDELDEIRRPRKGDILYTLVGSYGIPVMLKDDTQFCVQRHIGILRPSNVICREYLFRTLESGWVFDQATACATGIAQKTVPLSGLRKMIIPLPPVAEQQRIADRVRELMALCDNWETAKAQETRDRTALVSSANYHLDTGAGNGDLCSHADFFLKNLRCLISSTDDLNHLRKTILGLAVRGRLVNQRPDEQSAPLLLERFGYEKQRRVASGDLKPSGPLNLRGDESQFEYPLPASWVWCFVDELAFKVTDGEHLTPERCSAPGRYFLSARNVTDRGVDLTDVDFVPDKEYQRIRSRCNPDKGDILLSCSGSIGRAAVVDEDDKYVMVRSAALIKIDSRTINSQYLTYALRADPLQGQIRHYSKSTAQANLFMGAIRKLRVPLPPLAEQQRIVAKVDALMKLCDELEARITSGAEVSRKLLEAVLSKALAINYLSGDRRNSALIGKTDNLFREEDKPHERTI
jgi:type I restriction enzyme S subunit